MKLSIIAKTLNGELKGPDCDITGISDLDNQQEGTIAFAENKKALEILKGSKVAALIIPKSFTVTEKSSIIVDDPKFSFIKILQLFSPIKPYPEKVYPNVYIADTAKIGKNVTIMPFVTIMDQVEIGDGTIIYSQVFIGKNSKIGKNCLIKAGVKIDDECTIGDNVIIHHNSVIGGDGYGYIQKDGRNIKIPQIGKIVIEDDVELGACVTVDRATIGETRIGEGTKVDNLVQVAHNVKIGSNSIIVSQTAIGGSSTIGKNCIIGGQVGIADHAKIGDNVLILSQSGIEPKPLPSGKAYFGSPAREVMDMKRIISVINRLPEISKTVNLLKKKCLPDEGGED